MNRRNVVRIEVLLIGIALYAVFILNSCKKTQAPLVVRFGSGSIAVDYAPYIVAKTKGWYDEALKARGATAQYTVFQSPAPVNEAFASDHIDLVVIAEPPLIVGRAAGIDIKIVAISCTLVQEIVARSTSRLKSVADLRGKKIAVLAGSSSHYGLFKRVEDVGLKPSDIQVIDMTPPDAKAAFDTGQVDAWAVWPPWVEEEEIAGTGRVLTGSSATIDSLLAARGKFTREHADLVQDIVAVHERAKRWIIDHPDEAQQIVASELNVPLNVIKLAWPRHTWSAQLTDAIASDIQAKADFLRTNGFIKGQVDVRRDLIDASFTK